jgi:hypothetical protein
LRGRIPFPLVGASLVVAGYACSDLKTSSEDPPGAVDAQARPPGAGSTEPSGPGDASLPPGARDASTPTDDGGVIPSCGAELAPDAGAPDREWARWKLPASSPPAASYVVASETVCDRQTALTWQRTPVTTLQTWDEASATCETLTLGGRTDWRLPTRIELLTLIDFGKDVPAIDQAIFPGTAVLTPADAAPPEYRYWSTTAHPTQFLLRFLVGFDSGQAKWTAKDEKHAVRCVRGGA